MCNHRTCIRLLLVIGVLLVFWGSLTAETVTSERLRMEQIALYGNSRTFQIEFGDLDGDGDLDAVFANIPQYSEVWMNDGFGNFRNAYQNVGYGARGMGLGDLDGDGDLDVVMAPASSSERSLIYLNDGTGRFRPSVHDFGDTSMPANCMSLFDVDGDGDLDAGIYYPTSQRHTRLYLNDGTGDFSFTGIRIPGIAAWGDIDGDGDLDTISVQHEQTGRGFKVFVNLGNADFEETQHIHASSAFIAGSTAFADADNDGDLDVIAVGSEFGEAPLTLLRNDGSGRFEGGTAGPFSCPPGRLSVGDINGDGSIDVYVGCLDQSPRIALGDGAGGFADSGAQLGSVSFSGIAALGDLDTDGDLDIFAPSYGTDGGPNVIWINTTASGEDSE